MTTPSYQPIVTILCKPSYQAIVTVQLGKSQLRPSWNLSKYHNDGNVIFEASYFWQDLDSLSRALLYHYISHIVLLYANRRRKAGTGRRWLVLTYSPYWKYLGSDLNCWPPGWLAGWCSKVTLKRQCIVWNPKNVSQPRVLFEWI